MNNPLDNIMGVTEASARWGLTPEAIIRLSQEGKLQALHLPDAGGVWVLVKDQPAPLAAETAAAEAPKPAAPKRTAAGDRGSSMHSRLRDALYE
ncbi:hypothetical protein [Gorillibacterium sp. sgz5001074]|uniref:hypothetical protein n=1 Tax=Gorillibacterium sp. sgz5001074 TaxID=3446695 RepID=UPI003F6751B6